MTLRWVVPVTAAVLLGRLHAQGVAYEGGIAIATGSYFYTTATTSWTVSTGFSYMPGRFILRAAAPIYVQNSSLVRSSGAGMMPSGGVTGGNQGGMGGGGMMGGGATMHFRAAVGDPTVQVGWRPVSGARTALTVSAATKVPATDTSDYGTGKWDVGGMVSLTRRAGATLVLGLDASYWHLGDLPALDFRDPVAATVSAGRLFANAWGASLFVTAGTSALRGYRGPISVGAALVRLERGNPWGLSAAVGFTETTPDFSLGANWRIAL